MSLCEHVVQSRWDEFVMQGKLLIPEKSLQLSENNLSVVEKLMQDAALKVVFLAIEAVSKNWTMPIRNWKPALNRFIIEFEEQLAPHI